MTQPQLICPTLHCPACGYEGILPFEPLYSLEFAAALLLMKVTDLVNMLHRHKDEFSTPTYRWVARRRFRFITASDVRTVRNRLYSTTRFKNKNLQFLSDTMREARQQQQQRPLAAPPLPE